MRRATAIALLCLAGCSGDPESSRLEPGTRVIAYSEAGPAIYLDRASESDWTGACPVAAGSELVVLDDPSPANDKPPGWASRPVRVSVRSGEMAGAVGDAARMFLRPAR